MKVILIKNCAMCYHKRDIYISGFTRCGLTGKDIINDKVIADHCTLEDFQGEVNNVKKIS